MKKITEIKTEGGMMIVEVGRSELACRILEGMTGALRPDDGSTAEEALEHVPAETKDAALNAADQAMAYFVECMQKGGSLQ